MAREEYDYDDKPLYRTRSVDCEGTTTDGFYETVKVGRTGSKEETASLMAFLTRGEIPVPVVIPVKENIGWLAKIKIVAERVKGRVSIGA